MFVNILYAQRIWRQNLILEKHMSRLGRRRGWKKTYLIALLTSNAHPIKRQLTGCTTYQQEANTKISASVLLELEWRV
jgi:ssDNA-specific exonuclease RecJ